MINVDFNFGSVPSSVDPGDDELETLKNSPSHQSDSGMSMGSENTECMESDIANRPGFELFDDAELMGYLSSTSRTPSPETTIAVESVLEQAITNNSSSCCVLNNKCETKNQVRILRARNSNNIDKPTKKPHATEEKSKSLPVVKTILPMPTSNVKVVKVVSSINQDIDSDGEIVEALAQRNKKNAVQAKINREKKKAFIKGLEDTVAELRTENDALKLNQTRMEEHQRVLEDEVQYLKSVLANQSALSSLLQNIPNVQNIKLSTSFNRRKRGANLDHDYTEHHTSAKRSKNFSTAGVCLHVDDGHASLEFCSHCSKNAKSTDDA
ncbi:LOW QUALITY PROTEIN: probable basic-leucine zipper transcription factor D [Argopecten irradians]|uniref:LOW QUALITY PROTEIN: probable basic-leucine zipper transcription factor D n=1 Tax=Argopecten irradians TaxID=31199 RepID=UPI00371376AC